MTKDNKTSTARETVYDRCAYVGCYNGKFINGRRLFHFPAETDRRLEMWIERSGNFRLRTWAATSLRKAGLCGDHFDEKCFTNATRKALRRNVVPRHYTEDLKYRNSNNGSAENANENMAKNNARSEESDDPMNCDRLSPLGESANGQEKNHRSTEIHDESSLQSDEFVIGETIKTSPRNRSPSPVVEFIVEELDESLIYDDTESRVEEENSIFEEVEEDEEEDASGAAIYENSPMSMEEVEETLETPSGVAGLRVNRSNSDVRTYFRSKNHRAMSADEMARVKLEMASGESSPVSDEENAREVATSALASRDSLNADCRNWRHAKMLTNLREENKMLRKTMRLLRQNLRRAKAREANYLKVRDMLKNIDEFLNVQECENPVARAMVKLALHKNRCPYTKEEKDFATQLYQHSPTAFARLRRAGCNFPGKNTMKRWIAEEEQGQPSTCNFMMIADGNEDDDDVAEDAAGDDLDDPDEEMFEALDEVNEVDEVAENMNHVVEDAEVAIDDLVEHLEEVIDDTNGQEIEEEEIGEYVQIFPPDEEEEEEGGGENLK